MSPESPDDPGDHCATVEKITAARPYKTIADLEAALAKGFTPTEAKRVARYFVLP